MDAEVKILTWLCLLSILLIACQSGPVTVTETTPTAFTTPSMTVSESLAEKPLPRSNHAMAYDSKRHVVVLFGGWSDQGKLLDDTWEYDGTTWQKIYPTISPSARADHSIVYDDSRESILLFGGTTTGEGFTNHIWEYDGKEWLLLGMQPHLSARHSSAIAYMPNEHSVILFGGYGPGGQLWDTWQLSDNSWKELEIEPPTSGVASTLPQMVYNSANNSIIFHSFVGHTFSFDGQSWSESEEITSQDSSVGVIWGFRLAYDSRRNVIVLFGGEQTDNRNDTWEHDGGKWYQPSVASQPPSRLYHAMVYDEARGVVVLFGGFAADETYLNDTWEYDGVTWTQK
jgi:hypothetical protein